VVSVAPSTVLIVAALIALAVIVGIVLLIVRASRPRPAAALPSAAPSSPTAIVCQFCKREYEPSQTGRRCPGCGAASPR
jgi:hypothetical protein